jgi:uncharacterized protein with HEPN domain
MIGFTSATCSICLARPSHLLQIVGEAARHVSQAFQDAHPEVPWNAIIGMRQKVVHDYMNIDEDVVWTTATQELAPLVAQLERIVPPSMPPHSS